MEFQIPVAELIRRRRSVRSYDNKEIKPSLIGRIDELLARHTEGPFGNQISFHFINKAFGSEGEAVKLGTYGFIKGARYFIAGEVIPAAFSDEDYGYLMEKIMLHLLEMDLGSCWLGGTFKRSEIAKIIGASGHTIIPAITPVGYAAPSMAYRERLMRKGAGSNRRKAWDELFFDGTWGTALRQEEEEAYSMALAMVRLGPSASNKQPWRIVRSGPGYHFFLSRSAAYGKAYKHVDLQRIDMGIAMAHFELSIREAGLSGSWKTTDPGLKVPSGNEYTISWWASDPA